MNYLKLPQLLLISLIILEGFNSIKTTAQTWDYWEKHQGSDLHLTDLHLDKTGYLWALGTNRIYRFDKDTTWQYWNSLNSNLPEYFGIGGHFWIDESGVVWLATSDGIYKYENGSWSKFVSASEAKGDFIVFDKSNHIWVSGYNDILKEWDGIEWKSHADVQQSVFLYVDASNSLWAITNVGTIKKYDGQSWTQYDKFNTTLTFDQLSGIGHIVQDGNGDYWFSNDVFHETYQFDENANTWTVHTPNSLSNQKGMAVDLANQLWVAEGSALFKFSNGTWTELAPTIVGPFIMHDVVIDNDGTKWIGGQNGLLKYVDGGSGPIVLNINKERTYYELVSCYPNPANDNITIEINRPLTNPITLELIDSQGKVVLERPVQPVQQRYSMNISSISNGTYLLKITSTQNIQLIKLVIDD